MIQKQPILNIILIVAVLLLPFLDILEVTIMEARNFITAREMLTDGNWILTTMNGEARYQKPPLPTWITAGSAMIFGAKSVWGLRLPSVLMIMLLGVMLYTLSRKLTLSKNHSFLNSIIGVTSLYVVLIIFEAPWDIYTHAFMLVAIYSIVQIFTSERITFKYIFLAIVFIGCSVLSKGPISVYVLLVPFLISYGVLYRKEIRKKKWITIPVILIFGLALGFSWYFYVRHADPEIFELITTKETRNWTSYNIRPFYYYWSFFTQSGIWTIPAFISLLYPYLKTRVSNLRVYQFTLLWTLLIVVLLSVIPEKKSRYLMPVLIPLAINTGFYIEYLIRRFKALKDKRETIPVYFYFGVIGLAFISIPIFFVYLAITEEKLDVPIVAYVFEGLLFVMGIILLQKLYQKSIKRVLIAFIFGLLAIVYSLGTLRGYNKIVNTGYSDFDNFAQYYDIEDSKTIYAYKNITPEMILSSGRKIKVINSIDDLPKGTISYVLDCYDCKFSITTDKDINDFLYEVPYLIDLNYELLTSGNYKDRKVGYVYTLTIPK